MICLGLLRSLNVCFDDGVVISVYLLLGTADVARVCTVGNRILMTRLFLCLLVLMATVLSLAYHPAPVLLTATVSLFHFRPSIPSLTDSFPALALLSSNPRTNSQFSQCLWSPTVFP
jgi:hypothetical protein